MAGFSEVTMAKHLDSLNMTEQSIRTVSMWLLHHQKNHADSIVRFWLKEVKKEIQPNRLVNLLYLANDVIQNSRKTCPEFMALFFSVLEPAFKHASVLTDTHVMTALKKIILVFRQRQIYDSAKIDRLISAVTSSLTGARLVEFNMDVCGAGTSGTAGATEKSSASAGAHSEASARARTGPPSSHSNHHSGSKAAAVASPSTSGSASTSTSASAQQQHGRRRGVMPTTPPQPHSSGTSKRSAVVAVTDSPLLGGPSASGSTPVDSSPDQKKSRLKVESYDYSAANATTTELLAVLRKLEDPPSADAEVRNLIASFPEEIANPSLLKSVKNEEQSRKLKEKINEAFPVVKDFCSRLAEEMSDRRNAQRLLTEFYDLLKVGVARNAELLASVNTQIEKLEKERAEVMKHFESLPDLSTMPDDALTPLPTLGELFKNVKAEAKNEQMIGTEATEEVKNYVRNYVKTD